jgi:hypothetical protein
VVVEPTQKMAKYWFKDHHSGMVRIAADDFFEKDPLFVETMTNNGVNLLLIGDNKPA